LRRGFWTIAVLAVVLARPARADVRDGGVTGADAGPGADAAARADAATIVGGFDAAPAPFAAPPPTEPARPPELSSATLSSTPTLIGTPSPAEAEPPRPITKRLWFWMAVSGAVVAAVLVGMVVRHPNVTHPECPPDYVCPK